MWVTVLPKFRVHVRAVKSAGGSSLHSSGFYTPSRAAVGTKVLLPKPWRLNLNCTTCCFLLEQGFSNVNTCAQVAPGDLAGLQIPVQVSGRGPQVFHSNKFQVIPSCSKCQGPRTEPPDCWATSGLAGSTPTTLCPQPSEPLGWASFYPTVLDLQLLDICTWVTYLKPLIPASSSVEEGENDRNQLPG